MRWRRWWRGRRRWVCEAEAGGPGKQRPESGRCRGRRLRGLRSWRLKVELSAGSVQHDSGAVVGTSGVLGCGEGAEPFTGPLSGLSDLGHPLAPAPLSDSSVAEFAVIGSSLSFAFPVVGVGACACVGVGNRSGKRRRRLFCRRVLVFWWFWNRWCYCCTVHFSVKQKRGGFWLASVYGTVMGREGGEERSSLSVGVKGGGHIFLFYLNAH